MIIRSFYTFHAACSLRRSWNLIAGWSGEKKFAPSAVRWHSRLITGQLCFLRELKFEKIDQIVWRGSRKQEGRNVYNCEWRVIRGRFDNYPEFNCDISCGDNRVVWLSWNTWDVRDPPLGTFTYCSTHKLLEIFIAPSTMVLSTEFIVCITNNIIARFSH